MKLPLSLLLCIALTQTVCAGQDCSRQATQTIHIHSTILQDDKPVFVRLPKAYCDPTQRFPVIYLMDADMHMEVFSGVVDFLSGNDRFPPMIIVGVTHRDRNHELTPTVAAGLKADGSPSPLPTSGVGLLCALSSASSCSLLSTSNIGPSPIECLLVTPSVDCSGTIRC
jgi:hypothetical protein